MLFFYIRHGDPIYDPDSLTPLGIKQADALAKRLALYGLDRIYTSTSNRAKMTAQPTCELLKKEPIELDWTNEAYAARDFGSVLPSGTWTWSFFNSYLIEKFNSKEIRALGEKWIEDEEFVKNTRFAEGVKRVNEETDRFFEELGYRHDRENGRYIELKENNQRIALFAHQGFGMSFLSSLLDIPYPQFSTHFDFGHSSMTVIEFTKRGQYVYPKVLQLSNDSHIYREGLPTKYQTFIYF